MTRYKNRKMISITLSPDTIEKLEFLAQEDHCNKSQTISNLIWRRVKEVSCNGTEEQETTTAQK